MKIYTKTDLEKYLKDDVILKKLQEYPYDSEFPSHQWLLDMQAKRLIYHDIYGELLNSKGKKILDVGGGFCGLSRELIKRHEYKLLDIMAHGDHNKMRKISLENSNFWINSDWNTFQGLGQYDYVIANDIFPNVDQRLKAFISKFKSHTNKIIMTLTCYDEDRYYTVKRLDADEIFTIVPWNSAITEMILRQSIINKNIKLPPLSDRESIFKNGRILYRVDI
ncbi:MAG: hypothetical protein COV31_00115 [Candidatus Yanofskybacteria bacterium CG10_big_fil_rev_8_21_14_0_10_46_23]|uniref:Methyltransferase domain-containing protein n=1 Tax=Candidatus Yanofskybacteria bacterium CG10_big_fil_rev_8_21_14_0_10_46_23 TaxID=1975098 RepID=A0A2H0R527_9BACT|nr:MAG: hypothetical protein COV31_00115 [Candidatus Yanofskybacteria bacterium CG10_big_fil_rev_8_21_14_0_10_46_23]